MDYKGFLLDVYPVHTELESYITLCFFGLKKRFILEDRHFKPYLYLISKQKLTEKDLKNKFSFLQIEEIKKDPEQLLKFGYFKEKPKTESELKDKLIYKIYFHKVSDLVKFKESVPEEPFYFGKLEYDIPFDIRYCIDKDLKSLHYYNIKETDKGLEFSKAREQELKFRKVALDIETMTDELPNPKKDPIVLISLYSQEPQYMKVIGYNKFDGQQDYYVKTSNEYEMLKEFIKSLKEIDPDIIYSYSGDNFDFPYIKERCRFHKLEKELKSILDYDCKKTVGEGTAYTTNVQHLDVYKMVKILSQKGSLSIFKLDLDSVYNFLFGKNKVDIKYKEFQKYYNNAELFPKLVEYNYVDSSAAYEIGENFLQQFISMSEVSGKTLQETARASSSTLVESVLMYASAKENKIIPNMPGGNAVEMRSGTTYEGGFVKEPEKGLHENICVVDFQALYPSIIITHNISPETLNVKTENVFKVSTGDFFSQDIKATIPETLKSIFKERLKIKKEMLTKEKNSLEYKTLFAHQWSLKNLLNSTIGYFGYPRARWYTFDCANATLTLAREAIHKVIENAQLKSFEILYSDTDSCFIKYKKDKKEIEDFVKNVNSKLPGIMELSIDGFYKRGLFVQKKTGEDSAKKKYALLGEDNKLKIVGFEFVRHDWCKLARELQKRVLELILKENDINGAKQYVSDVVKWLENHEVKNEDLIIYTQMRKDIKEYVSVGPAVSAVKKAQEKGIEVLSPMIGFIVTSKGKTTSEKAEISSLVKEGDYDSSYYIDNQIIPTVKNIFALFNISEDELKSKPKQRSLFW